MERVFDFIDPYMEAERAWLAQKDLLTEEGVRSVLEILGKRLADLAEPVVSGICREELERIAPASVLGPSFVDPAQREEAREAAAERLKGPGDPFLKYAELDRCRLAVCHNFRGFIDRFVSRVEAGREGIRRGLLQGRDPGRICRLSSSGADCHLHGSSALRVETEGGAFYYKPRDCGPDELFARLAASFFDGQMRAPSVQAFGGDYGFVEAVRAFGLEDEKDIGTYFYRFGILLSLFRSLGSNDMHFENIVASGGFPVCIDLETLITPIRSPFEGTDYRDMEEIDPVIKRILFSSANTMALPMLLQGKAQMSPLYEKSGESLPVYRGQKRTVVGFEERLADGFSRGYDIIRDKREEIAGLLNEYRDMASRFVLRSSSYYALTLQDLHSPAFLEDSARRERELDRLGDRLRDLKTEDAAALVRWERESLEEGDIPYFSLTAGGRDLCGAPYADSLVRDFFEITALDHAGLCLRHMGDLDKRFETDYLRVRLRQAADLTENFKEDLSAGSAASASALSGDTGEKADFPEGLSGDSAASAPGLSGNTGAKAEEAQRQMTCEEALLAAGGLMEEIKELEVRVSDRDCVFLSFDENLVPQYSQGIGKGLQGMALFFAKYAKVLPDRGEEAEKLLEMSRSDSLRLIRRLSRTDLSKAGKGTAGLLTGIGGLFMSPALCGPDPAGPGTRKTDLDGPGMRKPAPEEPGTWEPDRRERALEILLSMAASLIREDRTDPYADLTLADGLAGLAAGLDHLPCGCGGEDCTTTLFDAVADRLLDTAGRERDAGRRETNTDVRKKDAGRKEADAGLIYGMMKGKAGLMYALCLCAGHVKEKGKRDRCMERGRELVSEILAGYSSRLGAWPDRERLDRPLFPACDLERGAPGIGLMASRCLNFLPEAEELLRLAADSVRSDELLETDTLLKGNAGAALCLIEAARALNDRNYLAHAGRILQKMKERADRAGGFRVLPARYTNAPDPSFMDGYAGIGYVFLCYAELVRAGEAEDPAHGSGEAHRQYRQSRKRERSLFPV